MAAPLIKPLSRCTVTLSPADTNGLPIVSFHTFMNEGDSENVVAIVRRVRAFWQNPKLAPLGPSELTPGPQFQTDDEIAKAHKVTSLLRSLNRTVRGMPPNQAAKAVQACVVPVATYGAEVWWPGLYKAPLCMGKRKTAGGGVGKSSTRQGHLQPGCRISV